MAEKDQYIGEFRRGPAIFTVFGTGKRTGRYRVECDDGTGRTAVCVLTDRAGESPEWEGRWQRDRRRAWIESEARAIIERTTA